MFAADWLHQKQPGLRPATYALYRDPIEKHLLPTFGAMPVDAITAQHIDAYAARKLREGRLSAESINKTIARLGQILSRALDYGYTARNSATGKGRKLKTLKNRRAYLDNADHITALLDTAGEIDREPREDQSHVGRRAIIATLVFGGLRISELCALRWEDVDLASGWLRVVDSKTEAGIRTVRMLPVLRRELVTWRGKTSGEGFVFATSEGTAPRQRQRS